MKMDYIYIYKGNYFPYLEITLKIRVTHFLKEQTFIDYMVIFLGSIRL